MTGHAGAPGMDPTFSLVIPVYNEADSLGELVASIDDAMAPLNASYEIVFVDDGSTDGSFERLTSLSVQDARVRVFSFRRNLGKSAALRCGLQKARGEYILTLDADLQDDPGNVSRMYEQLRAEGADIVNGWRKDRQDNVLKLISSRIFSRASAITLSWRPWP